MHPRPPSPPDQVEPPVGLDARIALGRCHRVAGELDAAVRVFTDAHAAFPDQARPLVERGAVLILAGRYAQTLADYDAAAAIDPHYPGLDSYRAELFLYTGRAADALVLSDAAAAREPGNLMHRINIAHAELLLGHTDLALEHYRLLARDYHPTKKRHGSDIALADLRLLLDAGVDVPQVDAARVVLAPLST
jgi:tetratricopeptide (TPR) repeat protein